MLVSEAEIITGAAVVAVIAGPQRTSYGSWKKPCMAARASPRLHVAMAWPQICCTVGGS